MREEKRSFSYWGHHRGVLDSASPRRPYLRQKAPDVVFRLATAAAPADSASFSAGPDLRQKTADNIGTW